MLRWLTAGESHGPALVAILEGLPAHVLITSGDIADALARRRLGFGRGARMKFEADAVTILGGIRHGETQGGPIAIQVANTEWPKWQMVMAADPFRLRARGQARNAALTRPRPGHADLVGMQKYDFESPGRYWSVPAPARRRPGWRWAGWHPHSCSRRSVSAC